MNQIYAIAFSLSKTWSYSAKKEAMDRAESLDELLKSLGPKFSQEEIHVAETQVKKLEKYSGWIWVYKSADYPSPLYAMPDPPLLLYGIGQQQLDLQNSLALVGTRKPTPYGNRIAAILANELVEEGITLVSGLARGIDSIAHRVSIELNAPTIAVLAHGLDITYPPEHKKMKEGIIEKGIVLSEFPFGIEPRASFFPQRNRIISGLASGVLVIEAGLKSGTRLTVNHALEQSREVFAVPGPIDSDLSIYTNELISQGATMVRGSQDILASYPNRTSRASEHTKKDFKPNKIQQQILGFLDKDEPRSIEDFMTMVITEPSRILQNLTELELYGGVAKQMDSKYILQK